MRKQLPKIFTNMFSFVYSFFYNIEGACMYFQRKLWGKYATDTWGYRVIELTTSFWVLGLTLLAGSFTEWHPFFTFVPVLVVSLIFLFSYYGDPKYDKIEEDQKLKDFNAMSGLVRFFYLFYVFVLFYLIPWTLIILIVVKNFL